MSERSLGDYIEATASPSPAPGAGSVAALCGAMGAALGEMVCGITLNAASTEHATDLDAARNSLRTRRLRLMELSPLDEAAYLAFREAQALPKQTDDEKAIRRQEMQTALHRAADVPLEIAETSCSALEQLLIVGRYGSRYTLADMATAGHVLNASISGALENVNVNISLIRDEFSVKRLSGDVESIEGRRRDALARVMEAIAARQSC